MLEKYYFCYIFIQMSNSLKATSRLAANSLPVYRAYSGYKVAERLRGDMLLPEDRTWPFAGRVAVDASTDMIDGVLARYAGTTIFGGYIDQLADKFWYLAIVKQLVKNRELEPIHHKLALVRDIGTTAIRPVAQHFGLHTDAQLSGKVKMCIQSAAVVAACSPLANSQPNFVHGLFDAATLASAASALDMLYGYAVDLGSTQPTEPAARLIVAATTSLIPLLQTG